MITQNKNNDWGKMDKNQELIKKIKKTYNKANDVKSYWQDIYDRVYSFTIPFRGRATKDDKPNGTYNRTDSKLFNSVGQQAAVSFVNRIQQLLTPIDSDFISMEAGAFYQNKDLSILEVNKYLESVCNVLNTSKAISNFDSAMSEFYFDLVAGTACILAQPGTPEEPIIFKTIPFREYCITEGANGSVDAVFRKFILKVDEIDSVFKDANKKCLDSIKELHKENEQVELLESCMYDYGEKKWKYIVLYEANDGILVNRVYGVNPFIILRWNKSSDDYYGHGIGVVALNDLYTYNRIMKDSMSMLAFSLPIILADSDDVFADDFEFEPLTVNKTKFVNGKPSVQQLEINTDIKTEQFHLDELKQDIFKNMLANTIPNNPVQMTATEIQQRVAEQQVDFTSVFGRLIREFLYQLPKVMIQILQEYFGLLEDFDINKINGFNVKIRIKTPLARINREQNINNTMQAIQLLLQFDPSGSMLQRYLKLDNTMIDMLQAMGIDRQNIKSLEEISRDDKEQAVAMQAQQEQAMQQQVAMQGAMEENKARAQAAAKPAMV